MAGSARAFFVRIGARPLVEKLDAAMAPGVASSSAMATGAVAAGRRADAGASGAGASGAGAAAQGARHAREGSTSGGA
jgi:hypothetical protein